MIKDVDGNEYKTIVIGNQEWSAENLRTTKYNDGTPILNITDNATWKNDRNGAYCYYDNNENHKAKHGALYNWHAVNTNKLAPQGWRVPSNEDWDKLQKHLIDFTGVLSGCRCVNGYFGDIGYYADWWSSSESGASDAGSRYLYHGSESLGSDYNFKECGFSVRFLRDL